MNVDRCNCKHLPKTPSDSNLCSCRKNRFSRMSACDACLGISCYNGTVDREENVSNDDFENYDK